ncbi:MAG: cell division protein FtsQ/DivIB [Crocinitomicaceae bacterium]|nr:cell division protein FtsQ/DivIB [Crocinitomicaceae bacterium]
MKKWFIRIAWVCFFGIIVTLLFLARNAQEQKTVAKPVIVIHVDGENAFLTEDELYTRLKRKRLIFDGQTKKGLSISGIEKYIRSMSEVKETKVFTNIGATWKIEVKVRKPIARVFNKYGETFYLDEEGVIMKASNLHTARVVVVTGNIKDRITSKNVKEIINNKFLKSIQKLDEIYRISYYVCNDPLMRALIGQIHYDKKGDFVLIPLIGGQKIIFGSAKTAEEVSEKFKKLKIFYKEAIPFEGWNKYKEIGLKYKNQIVCKTVDGYTEENKQ